METNAYAELKSRRDAARSEHRILRSAESSLKSAHSTLKSAPGEHSEFLANLWSMTDNIIAARTAAQEVKEALEAEVTAARAAYRLEKLAQAAQYVPVP